MIVLISNTLFQTYLFSAVLILALALSLRKRQDQDFFPISASQELKGFAILTIVLAHVAYALVSDSTFLHPLSTMAGVGVNLFLILSGYGIMVSSLKKPLSIGQFYKRRLLNLFVPFWICLIAFFALDYFFLHLNYGLVYMIKAFFGIFTHADLYQDVNAPFWYFSWIVLYYLLFPLVFIKKSPWLSAIIIYVLTFSLVAFQPHFLDQVAHLYRVHVIAFPMGMLMGWFFRDSSNWLKIKDFLSGTGSKKVLARVGSCLVLLAAILYLAGHAGIGDKPIIEELISNLTCLLIIAFVLIKRIEIKTFYLLGIFSYEIYMFHWPLMYRYDFLFKFLPAWLALSLYFVVFIALGWVLKKIVDSTGSCPKKPEIAKIDK